MQVKKFEAPTIQEALEHIKRELGPEAIILQTKKNKRGFGLMSKSSVEVTAAVSERSLQKKQVAEKRLPEPVRQSVQKMPAYRQAELYSEMTDSHLGKAASQTRDKVELGAGRAAKSVPAGASRAGAPRPVVQPARAAVPEPKPVVEPAAPIFTKPITERRYIDIEDDEATSTRSRRVAQEKALPGQIADKKAGAPVGSLTLEQEVEHLKRMLTELHRVNEREGGSGVNVLVSGVQSLGTELTPALQDVFEQLVVSGIDRRFALSLIKKVKFELGETRATDPEQVIEQVASEIMETTEVISPLDGIEPGRGQMMVLAVVGPTGVGKTTTVAKIAAHAQKKGLSVGLVNLDTYKVAAFDQLATYAKILNVPFRSASSLEDFKAAIGDFSSLDLVLVDTTGRSHRDPGSLNEMEKLLNSVPGVQTHLVLASTTRDAELYEMASRFTIFHPQGLILSKLDEASTHGAIYNVSHRVRLPLLYFTTGQRVPEDIEEASRERLVTLLMDL